MINGLNQIILSLLLILGELRLINCGSDNEFELRAINLIKTTPLVNRDNSQSIMENRYNVYYYKDLIMYMFNYRFDSLVDNEMVLQETRYFYFVSHKDSAYGYKYQIKIDETNTHRMRYKKDSLLKSYGFESNVYDTLINFKPDSIYNKKNEIIKVYKNPRSGNIAQQVEKSDLYFYYNKELKNISETFSRKMDNIKGMKLYKIVIKVSGGYYTEYEFTFPPRELLQEMKEITIENKDEIMSYFRKYQEKRL
ncbi:MAG TPA: hypothetical protein VIU35_07580 [Chitinophagaceae bacterium]